MEAGGSSNLNSGGGDRSRSRSPNRRDSQPQPLLPPMLPSDEGKPTLVLGMDGTLVHECRPPACNSLRHGVDFVLHRKSIGARTFVSKRPFLEQFLREVQDLYEIVIFTESSKRRADVILDRLESSKCIRHRLYRDSCTEVQGRMAKDLSLLGRDLSKVILVDAYPFSHLLQPYNAFPIGWFDGTMRDDDSALALTGDVLRSVRRMVDVRPWIKRYVWDARAGVPPRRLDAPLVIERAHALNPIVEGPLLPPMNSADEGKHTLVLDLDETLVFGTLAEIPGRDADFRLARGRPGEYEYFYVRPGVAEFLASMEELFEIVVFTASVKVRAELCVKHVDVRGCVRFCVCREGGLVLEGGRFIKDLSRLGRELRKVVIIDDYPSHFELQPSNGIRITPFNGDPSDRALTDLIPFLKQLRQQQDVRPLIQAAYDRQDRDLVAQDPLELEDHSISNSWGGQITSSLG